MTRMHCSHAKTDIALLVGGDLDQEAIGPLETHLECCPDCAAHFASMQRHLMVLQSVQEMPLERRESVWPRLAPALSFAEQQRRVKQFNGWVASVAVAAICLAMVTLSAEFRPNLVNPYAHENGAGYDRVAVPAGTADRAVRVHGGTPVRFQQDAVIRSEQERDEAAEPSASPF